MEENKKLKRGERPKDWKNHCPKFKEYYKFHNPEWDDEKCIVEAKKYNKSINWQCVEYYQRLYPQKSFEECEQLRQEAISKKNENHSFNMEYYRKHYPNATEDECRKMLSDHAKQNNFQSMEYYKKRFPNAMPEELNNMLNDAKQNYIKKRGDNSGENNPAHKSKTTELERKQRSPMCIEFYQKKYPELSYDDQLELLNNHKKNIKTTLQDKTKQSKCVEYWIAKGYTKKEAKEIISKSQATFTLESCIKKYGEEEGIKIFNERQNKWLKSFKNSLKNKFINGIQTSGVADEFFNKILNFASGSKEIILGKYAYDFMFENKIIEFNGDYWHANPKIYDKNYVNKTTGHVAKDIWKKDANKRKYAEKKGYKIYTVWESDYKNNPKDTINKCIEFLTS